MKQLIKKNKKIFVFLMRPFLLLFFKKEYLQGKWFDSSLAGYLWGIKAIWHRSILRLGRPLPWPVGLTCHINDPSKITFHSDDLNNFQSPGIYFQNVKGHIYLGRGVYIAPNVGIITANHKITNLDEHEEGQNVVIGDKSWIGMNSVILPGVVLGKRTIVAAGSIVTKSFLSGDVVIGGCPARVIKKI